MNGLLGLVAAVTLLGVSTPATAGTWHERPQPHAATHAADTQDWTWLTGAEATSPRWDPCTAITWQTAADGSSLDVAVTRGIARLARFTGYTFQRVDRGGAITVATLPVAEFNPGTTASSTTDMADRGDGRMWATAALTVVPEGLQEPMLSRVIAHELGHDIGLGHAASPDEVMYPNPRRARYAAGDRAGLAAVRPAECAPVTPPAQGEPAVGRS